METRDISVKTLIYAVFFIVMIRHDIIKC